MTMSLLHLYCPSRHFPCQADPIYTDKPPGPVTEPFDSVWWTCVKCIEGSFLHVLKFLLHNLLITVFCPSPVLNWFNDWQRNIWLFYAPFWLDWVHSGTSVRIDICDQPPWSSSQALRSDSRNCPVCLADVPCNKTHSPRDTQVSISCTAQWC